MDRFGFILGDFRLEMDFFRFGKVVYLERRDSGVFVKLVWFFVMIVLMDGAGFC